MKIKAICRVCGKTRLLKRGSFAAGMQARDNPRCAKCAMVSDGRLAGQWEALLRRLNERAIAAKRS